MLHNYFWNRNYGLTSEKLTQKLQTETSQLSHIRNLNVLKSTSPSSALTIIFSYKERL